MKLPGVARSGLIVKEPHRLIGFWMRIIALVAVTAVPVSLELLRIEPPWRLDWFDMLHRNFPRAEAPESPVRIVVLQNAPGGIHLQGIWPRDRLARLTEIIGYSGAKSIGLDLPLDDVGIYEHVEEQAGTGAPLAKTRALSEALRRHRVVVPVLLYDSADSLTPRKSPDPGEARPGDDRGEQTLLLRTMAALPGAPVMQASLPAHRLIRDAAVAEGLLLDELESDERLRKLPMVRVLQRAGRAIARFDSMSVEMLRLGLGLPRPELSGAFLSDARLVFANGLEAPLDWQGDLLLHLRPINRDFVVDADDVMLEVVDPAMFRDKYVIITTGYGDFQGWVDTTQFRFGTSGEIAGQVIEQILNGQFVYRPSWMSWAEIAFLVLIGCFPVFLFARYSPARIIPVCLAVAISIPAACAALFATTGIMVDGLGLIAGLTIIAAFALGTNLVDRDQDYLVANLSLLDTRAVKARLEGELDVARRIQMSLLPPRNMHFAGGLELACHIEPAQEVGGDFYDHVERPDGQVFFSIGDVSGKGVPASLFMALSKSLWKSAALVNDELTALQEQANRDITRDNRDVMFVTGVGCLFDPVNRTLRYCGAGHDMPVLARKGQGARTLDSSAGPPLGLDNGMTFPAGEIALQPGDLVCLFTDGFTEAELSPDMQRNGSDAFFGVKGILTAMQQAADAGATAPEALNFVLAHLERETAGSSQTDDRTIVVARYSRASLAG